MITDACLRALAPSDSRPIHEWAAENVVLSPPLTKTGKLDLSDSRHFEGILDALYDDRVREVNVLAPVRSGKSLVGDVWLAHCVARDPGQFRVCFQDADTAKEHFTDRTRPMLENCGVISELLELVDDDDNTTKAIRFPLMNLYIGGPSLKKLQAKGFRYMWLDEPWLYKDGTIDQAKGRLGDYYRQGNSKLLCTSQGGWVGTEWEFQFNSGQLHEWHVQCQSCGQCQSPEIIGQRADDSRWGLIHDQIKLANGDWDVDACKATVRFECFHCGHPHIDGPRTKSEWNRTGRWNASEPEKRDKKSFRYTSLIIDPWEWLCELWLQAENQLRLGNKEPKAIFFQKRVPENFDPLKLVHLPQLATTKLSYEPTGKWQPITHEGIEFIHPVMGVDVQSSSYWVLVMAFSARGDELILHAEEVYSWSAVAANQEQYGIPNENVCVDVSHRTWEVTYECCRHGSWDAKGRFVCWKAMRGSDQHHFVHHPSSGPDRNKRILLPYAWPPEAGNPELGPRPDDPRLVGMKGRRCQIITWSNPWIKDVVATRRDGKASGVKMLVPKAPWNEVFWKHLHDQQKKRTKKGWTWDGKEDHLNDCKCMCTVRAFQLHLIGGTSGPAEA